ncbi:hypothetical protein HLB44_05090 [Aquincola sp. S2]|uniref:Secreted protein n=1 Tax=Pseudaquabacterium terrae TaxID=2732868 RepID=A0ABX2EB62_9BURK|nr:hypothetical protein [Aquabacterium terrae]NRF66354.1 hypothetical protein [Aquabacterium terrae]
MRRSTCAFLAAMAGVATAGANDAPDFENGRLTLPRVDTPQQVGRFQDGVLEATSDGVFGLRSVQELGKGRLAPVLGISTVEVIKTASAPAAVFVRVSGAEPGCGFAGPARAHQRRVGTSFEVQVSVPYVNPIDMPQVCPANIRPFRITVPLAVYGAQAGTYGVTVNGVHTAQFTLDRVNAFADDCDVQKYGNCS